LQNVGIVGIGMTELQPSTPGLSYKELIFQAAVKAYEDAGVNPRKDIESFVCSSEDFWEGTSIFDEYVPDQLGAVQKPVCTISADGIFSLATAYMQILTGLFDIVAVEAHSKVSDVVNPAPIYELALDPIYNRPLGLDPQYVAGLEMARYMKTRKAERKHFDLVVEKNRRNAARGGGSSKRSSLARSDDSTVISDPLTKKDIAPLVDGAGVVVLASENAARGLRKDPVWIRGVGWASDSPSLETRDWSEATYAKLAAQQAYGKARIRKPAREIELAEIDDTYSYKELQHIEALGLTDGQSAINDLEKGVYSWRGALPTNPSGGSIGMGHTLEMSGLTRVIQLTQQLRGQAGPRQIKGAQTGVVLAWRGIPTATGAVVVLSNR